MEKELDIQTREEIIQAKLVDQEPLKTIVTTLARVETLEDQCYKLRNLVILLNFSVLCLIGLTVGNHMGDLLSMFLVVIVAGVLGYKAFQTTERDYKKLKDEYKDYRSQV